MDTVARPRPTKPINLRMAAIILIVCLFGLWIAGKSQQTADNHAKTCSNLTTQLEAVQSDYADANEVYDLGGMQVTMNRAVELTSQLDQEGCL